MFKLIIEDDEGHTTIVPLMKEEITIGRKEGNTIRLTERNVSRHHARLTKSEAAVFIEDLDSYNGVRVNGDRIGARTSIQEGDLVEIGDYHLALQRMAEQQSVSAEGAQMRSEGPPPLAAGQLRAVAYLDDTTAVVKMPPPQPIKDEPTQVQGRPLSEKEAGRLVAMNTELAGKVFPLIRSQMVIGRTEGCDIILDHRSISTRHAQIVYDAGVYRIMDLDSANGVLVNGEEYTRVDLRRGDLIELGHVTLRYVAPGEDYRFVPDSAAPQKVRPLADAMEQEEESFKPVGRRRRGRNFAVLCVVLLIGVVGTYVAMIQKTGNHEKPSDDPDKNSTALVNDPALKEAATNLFNEGLKKFNERNIEGALASFNEALAKNPSHEGAREMQKKAEQEIQNDQTFANAVNKIVEKDYVSAWELVSQIPEGSILSSDSNFIETKVELKKKYILFHLNQAVQMKDAGQLENAVKHLDSVLVLEENNAQATKLKEAIAKLQKTKTEKTEPPETPKKDENVMASKANEPNTKKDSGKHAKSKEVKDLIKKGIKLYNEKQYEEAISSFKKIIKIDPKNCEAYKSIAVVYAGMGNRQQAANFYQKFLNVCPTNKLAPQIRKILNDFRGASGTSDPGP